jgi:hypothetical protein
MKTIIICLLICFSISAFPMSLIDAWSTSIELTNEICDKDFWTKEMHIKCIEYTPYYKKETKGYYVYIRFEVTNRMESHNLSRFKLRLRNFSESVSCIIESPNPELIDECAMDGDFLCCYYNDRITLRPQSTQEFAIVAVINDINFDVVHSQICFHAMQRWWLRATPIMFDIRFDRSKILPKDAYIPDNADYNTYDEGGDNA